MMSARIDTLGLGSSSEEEEEEEEEDGDGGERNVLPSSATDLGRQTRVGRWTEGEGGREKWREDRTLTHIFIHILCVNAIIAHCLLLSF